jgi:SNF2 family DNA or RNA helicase
LKLDRFSNRILKEQCLDLPDKMYIRRDVELTDEQKRVYKQMKKVGFAKLENGELATTASVLTQIMRLQQICCGHLQPDEGEIQALDNNRLRELLEITDELQGKAIIWATYTHDIQQVANALRDRFGPEAVATYYGARRKMNGRRLWSAFKTSGTHYGFLSVSPRLAATASP